MSLEKILNFLQEVQNNGKTTNPQKSEIKEDILIFDNNLNQIETNTYFKETTNIISFLTEQENENNSSTSDIFERNKKDIGGINHCSAVEPTIPREIWGDIVDSLDGESKDGKIDETEQGATGDCWLLSGVNSLSYTKEGRNAIKNALEYRDGYTIVHFAEGGDYIISDEELNLTKSSPQYSSGDDDMIILELAFEKLIDDAANGKFIVSKETPHWIKEFVEEDPTTFGNSSTEGGYSAATMYFLTGKVSKQISNKDKKEVALIEFGNNKNNNIALSADVYTETNIKDINGNTVHLYAPHAYAVKNVDNTNRTVTVINPHDSSKEIVVDMDTFVENFATIYTCDLSENNKKESHLKIKDETRYTFKKAQNGEEYKITSKYDENGNIESSMYQLKDTNIGLEVIYDDNGNIAHGRIGQYNKKGIFKSENGLSKETIENIIKRDLLTFDQIRYEDLIYDNGIASLNDEEWEIAQEYLFIPHLLKQLTGNELRDISKLDENKRDNFIEFITEHKFANRESLLTYYKSVCVENLKDPNYIKNIVSLNFRNSKDLPQYIEQLSDSQIQKIIDRNLLTNTRINKKLSAYDVYVLSFIDDSKWNTAVRMINENPSINTYDLYKILYP